MTNVVGWTVSGPKQAMEVKEDFKDLRKLGVQNITQYSVTSCVYSTYIHFPSQALTSHTMRHVYRSVWHAREAKPHFGATLIRSAHDCETRVQFTFLKLSVLMQEISKYLCFLSPLHRLKTKNAQLGTKISVSYCIWE